MSSRKRTICRNQFVPAVRPVASTRIDTQKLVKLLAREIGLMDDLLQDGDQPLTVLIEVKRGFVQHSRVTANLRFWQTSLPSIF